MRRVLLTAAASLVLVANLWAVWQAWRNHQAPKGGNLELTDRELRLLPTAAESTATMLRLNWNVGGTGEEQHRAPEWLDRTRLTELGFDCSVAANGPGARRHYTSLPSRPVYLAVEYRGEAWRNAGAKAQARSGLFIVDAARDADRLRARYPDPQRHIICRGLVRLSFREQDRNGASLSMPRLEGRIESLRPSELFVPLPYNRALGRLGQPDLDAPPDKPPKEPRFVARICWGANYEPWLESVRLATAGEAEVKKP